MTELDDVVPRGQGGETESREALASRVAELERRLSDVAAQSRAEKEQLKASLHEKELLLREVHHRVKNNLQVITSLLSLQRRYAKKDSDRAIFDDMHNRVCAMALVHEELNLGSGDDRIDFKHYTKRLVGSLILIYAEGGISHHFVLEADRVTVDLDTAMTLGLLLNEAISNAFKHAFPAGAAGEITVRMWETKDQTLNLLVRDSGCGFKPDFDVKTSETLGLSLIEALVQQVSGSLEVRNEYGASLHVRVPRRGDQNDGSPGSPGSTGSGGQAA